MGFRDQKKCQIQIRKHLFLSPLACQSPSYKQKPYDFCIALGLTAENLYAGIQQPALDYFAKRGIGWHHWRGEKTPTGQPSDHLCCSQSACINAWFPLINRPTELAAVLRGMGYPVREMLPLISDSLDGDKPSYVAFEWIGERNYLGEHRRGRIAADHERTRGSGFTSADFILRFLREDGKVQIILGEWKYTEHYRDGACLQFSKSGTDRLRIYEPALNASGCQLRLPACVKYEDLFYDPFDQLMRLQLLASGMERNHEMEAEIVSVLHVAPEANRELMQRITSPGLKQAELGPNIHDVWSRLVLPERFGGCKSENLYMLLSQYAPDPAWADYLQARYM